MLFAIICSYIFSVNSYAQNIVVVIDPGHGGNSPGGSYEDRVEREIDLITATAMKQRLEQYEGVEVYLTRTSNEEDELTRKQRFEYAQSVNADFLYSIHYNMSEYHTLYGSEVWVCSSGEFYKKGYSFALIEMEALTGLGLFDRGIKCRLDTDGSEYYGILKYSREFNIPAVIIEHCHFDEERDSQFWNYDSYVKFGEVDADCVAKYFRLSSPSLGIDNSAYNIPDITEDNTTDPDTTVPDYCEIELLNNDETSANIKIKSEDFDSYIQYYSYSTDGGNCWSRLEDWSDRNQNSMEFTVELLEGVEAPLIVKTLNKYDLDKVSNSIVLPMKIVHEETPEVIQKEFEEIYINPVSNNDNNSSFKFRLNNDSVLKIILLILVVGTIILAFGTFIFLIVSASNIDKPKKRKDFE